jgi:predicted component of type VI protein secretion system
MSDARSYLASCRSEDRRVAIPLRHEAAPLLVGRAARMDVVLRGDPTVSSLHAELTYVRGEWVVADGGLSRNGTYVNGERVDGRHRLRHGDRLRFGRSELRFCLHLAPKSRPVAGVPRPPRTYEDLLAELARPLHHDPGGVPATDTQIAHALGLPIDAVAHAVAQLSIWYGLADYSRGRARDELAAIGLRARPRDTG